jgi:hypothetical protein
MAYQINKTDGTILTTVADGQIDQVSSDITLIGKNYSGFGEALNENLVKMLEHFADSSEPERPIRGQLWFDTRDLKLKVYIGNQFVPVSSATLSRTQPSTLAAGDLWYDETKGQLFFFDGSSLKLLGPQWSLSEGQSGLVTGSIFDNTNTNRVIVYLYVGGALIGIFSKDNFTPRSPIAGFTGSITTGFNASNLIGIKFNVTATNAETLGKDTTNPNGIPASSYVRNDLDSVEISGKVTISSTEGLTVGSDDQLSITTSNANTVIKVKRTATENALVFSPSSRRLQIYPDIPLESTVGLSGEAEFQKNLRLEVNGNMFVSGTLVAQTFSPETFLPKNSTVNERILYLAVPDPDFPEQDFEDRPFSNLLADGGGIVLKGNEDHSLTWTQESAAWNSTEHINLVTSTSVSAPEFKINGVTVLNANSLGPTITSAPGINNFGVQDFVEIGRESVGGALVSVLRLQGTKLQVLESNGNLELQANGTGNISLVGNPRIVGMADPIQTQDATTKRYVDSLVRTRPIVFSMDLSDNKSNDYIINSVLSNLAPTTENLEGTVARILCTILSNATQSLDVNSRLNVATEVFNRPAGTGLAVTGVTVSPVPIPGTTILTTRIVKVFTIQGGQWTFVSSTELPS